jgi:hypothetical protein
MKLTKANFLENMIRNHALLALMKNVDSEIVWERNWIGREGKGSMLGYNKMVY